MRTSGQKAVSSFTVRCVRAGDKMGMTSEDAIKWIDNLSLRYCAQALDVICEMLKEQEPRELTKEEWKQWKKDERRDPICMIWYGDTTPFWVLRPEEINEPLYLMGKIKLFTKKPPKEQVKWDD